MILLGENFENFAVRLEIIVIDRSYQIRSWIYCSAPQCNLQGTGEMDLFDLQLSSAQARHSGTSLGVPLAACPRERWAARSGMVTCAAAPSDVSAAASRARYGKGGVLLPAAPASDGEEFEYESSDESS